MIHLQCGHQVLDMEFVRDCKIAAYNDRDERVVKYVAFCPQCMYDSKEAGELLITEEDVTKWIGGNL